MATPAAVRSLEYWAYQYRRTWRGTVVTSVLSPLLFLAAMGIGLGSLVNSGSNRPGLGGVSYLVYLAPGLLAANAMQTAAGESTYPVMGAIKWNRNYHAMLATPLGVADVLIGHLLWITVRLLLVCAAFLGVMVLFGAVGGPGTALALPAAVLTGLAFAAPIMAFAATQENDSGFAALYRFGVVPLFLFSGTFFPISQLPPLIRPIAYLTPLWHGVDLCRGLALGTATAARSAVHVGYLLLWLMIGVALALRAYRSRLER